MCGIKWRAVTSCYTEGASLSPIDPPSNLCILLSISFHSPTRTFIAVFVSHAFVFFATCTSSGYNGWSRDQIPVVARFFAPIQTGSPNLLHNGYQVFPGGKVAGTWRCPTTPCSAEVKEIVELHSTPLLSLHGLF
jgi:hypothetical protein